jgi:hypothetical protein
LIVTEGSVTEPRYFEQLKTFERIPIHLETKGGAVPETLIDWAIELKINAEQQAKRQHDLNLRFDQTWCVFDVDEHPKLKEESKRRARSNHVNLAVSNPCFEIWVLLHFVKYTRYIERDNLRALLQQYLPRYQKELPCDKLWPLQETAHRRAVEIENWHATRGTSGENPSTDVYRIIDEIRRYRRS